MPPLPAVPNVIKNILRGISGEAQELPWANILHWAWTGASPTEAFMAALAGVIADAWTTYMAPEQVDNVTLTEIELFDLTSDTGASYGTVEDIAGTRGDDEIPANVCFLINYPVTRRYRGGHPRSYLMVGGNADFLDAAHWSTAFTSEVASHWESFLNAINGYVHTGTTITNLVNVSYYDKTDFPDPPYRRTDPLVDVLTIDSLVAEQQMASQRRRIGRHRR